MAPVVELVDALDSKSVLSTNPQILRQAERLSRSIGYEGSALRLARPRIALGAV